MIKVTVCKGCKQAMHAIDVRTKEPACTTCVGLHPESGVPEEVEVDVGLSTCTYCKSRYVGDGVPPFFDAKHMRHYDGCRGWD